MQKLVTELESRSTLLSAHFVVRGAHREDGSLIFKVEHAERLAAEKSPRVLQQLAMKIQKLCVPQEKLVQKKDES
jgi:hypothetical protein